MKTPQTADGFMRLATGDSANDFVMPLIGAQLTGVEWQIVMSIIRKTYGYGKKEDWISLGQFVQFSGRSKKGVCIAIAALEEKNIIHTRRVTQKTFYSFNKNFTSWKVVYPSSLVNSSTPPKKKETSVGQYTSDGTPVHQSVVNASTHTKENVTKDNDTKEIPTVILPIFSPLNFMPEFVVDPSAVADPAAEPIKKKKKPQPFNWEDYSELVRLMKKSCAFTTLENGKTPQDNYARHILLKLLKILVKEHSWPEQEAIDNIRANMEEFCAMVQRAREADNFLFKNLTTLKSIYFRMSEIFEVTKVRAMKNNSKSTSHLAL